MSERSDGPVAYTDGGCLGNPGPGGWGVHVEYPDGRVVELGGGELQHHQQPDGAAGRDRGGPRGAGWPSATIIADSQYVRAASPSGSPAGSGRAGSPSTGQPVVNRDLWEELDAVADGSR